MDNMTLNSLVHTKITSVSEHIELNVRKYIFVNKNKFLSLICSLFSCVTKTVEHE